MLNISSIGYRNFEALILEELGKRRYTAADIAAIYKAIEREMSAVVLPPITTLELFLSDGCNLNCTYCFEGSKPKQVISSELIHLTIDRLLLEWSQDRKEVQIVLFGGEPLLNWKGLVQTIEYSMNVANKYQKEVKFGITTNGTLLNHDMVQYLKTNNVSVMLSIDGIPKVHNAHRLTSKGLPSFPSAWRGFQLLREFYGSGFEVRVTVMPDTAPMLSESLTFLFENGAHRLVVIPATERRWTDREWKIYRNQAILAVNHFKAIRDEGQDVGGVFYISEMEQYKQATVSSHKPTQSTDLNMSRRGGKTGDFGCYAGIGGVAVIASGDVLPCSFFTGSKELRDTYTLGNVREEQLNNARRRELYVLNRHRTGKCLHCAAKQLCRGGCIVENYFMTGYLVGPSPSMCRRTGLSTAMVKKDVKPLAHIKPGA